MERVALKAQGRDGVGKGAARSLRRSGLVPAVVYGRGREARTVAVEARALTEALHTHAGMNVLIDLEMPNGDGSESTIVIVKDTQRDIFRHHLIHVDFHAISLTDVIEMHVPVVLNGTAKGVAEGGVIEHHLREVLVECLPTQVPDRFDLDVTELVVGRSMHASDLAIPDGVKLLTQPDEVIVTVVAPRVQEEAAPAAAAAPVEGAPAAPAEGAPTAPAPEAPAGEKPKASKAG
ncbi:MAG: 50S ribosomal protein L25 [Armatimonadota bacterium]